MRTPSLRTPYSSWHSKYTYITHSTHSELRIEILKEKPETQTAVKPVHNMPLAMTTTTTVSKLQQQQQQPQQISSLLSSSFSFSLSQVEILCFPAESSQVSSWAEPSWGRVMKKTYAKTLAIRRVKRGRGAQPFCRALETCKWKLILPGAAAATFPISCCTQISV